MRALSPPSWLDRAVQTCISAAFLFGSHAAARAAWPALLAAAGGSEHALFVAGTFSVHVGTLLALNGFYLALYVGQFPAVEARKISAKPWPWASPSAAERARFWASVRWGAATVLVNIFCVSLPSSYNLHLRVAPWGLLSASAAAFPPLLTVLWQVCACAAVEDVVFYHAHRALHWPPLYAWVHKWHHQFHHSVGLAAECAHPLEFYFGNLLPVFAGPLLVRAHAFTFWVWLAVRVFETCDAHSGYEFAWSPARLTPFASSAAAHDYHHAHNKGCFGSMFSVLDALYGTDAEFRASPRLDDASSIMAPAWTSPALPAKKEA